MDDGAHGTDYGISKGRWEDIHGMHLWVVGRLESFIETVTDARFHNDAQLYNDIGCIKAMTG
tara:strand:+ start:1146 stop:1331 length:186 start_codon:yes stop_codon:yes gene_type:complete